MPVNQYLEAGRVVGTHGIRGELRVQPWCDSPAQLAALTTLYWDAGKTPIRVKGRPHGNLVLLQVEGVHTVEDAAALRGRILFLNRDDVDLGGRYFIQDLLGLPVRDADDGTLYGEIVDVSDTGANNVYHMRTPVGREVLIPVIPEIVIQVDIQDGITIRPMKGLLDDGD